MKRMLTDKITSIEKRIEFLEKKCNEAQLHIKELNDEVDQPKAQQLQEEKNSYTARIQANKKNLSQAESMFADLRLQLKTETNKRFLEADEVIIKDLRNKINLIKIEKEKLHAQITKDTTALKNVKKTDLVPPSNKEKIAHQNKIISELNYQIEQLQQEKSSWIKNLNILNSFKSQAEKNEYFFNIIITQQAEIEQLHQIINFKLGLFANWIFTDHAIKRIKDRVDAFTDFDATIKNNLIELLNSCIDISTISDDELKSLIENDNFSLDNYASSEYFYYFIVYNHKEYNFVVQKNNENKFVVITVVVFEQ